MTSLQGFPLKNAVLGELGANAGTTPSVQSENLQIMSLSSQIRFGAHPFAKASSSAPQRCRLPVLSAAGPVSGQSEVLVGGFVSIGTGFPHSVLHPRPRLFAARWAAGCSQLWAAVLPQERGPGPAPHSLCFSSKRWHPR